MITRLEVDGFKSLQGFAVDLEPFTVFIGPNGAGKSNILEALALLSRLATQPIIDAFRHGRGQPSDQFSRSGGEVAREIRFAIEFPPSFDQALSQNRAATRARYELTIERVVRSSGVERLIVQSEKLGVRAEEGAWVFLESESGEVDHVPSGLAATQWLRLDLTHLAGPSDRVDTGTLRPDGSNLPTVLADLPGPLVGEIRADLVSLVPGLASFSVVPDRDAFEIEFELSGGEVVPARLISDGTLRVLALLTALRIEPRPSLIGIEEPENGIYPGRLRALIELLRRESEQDEEDMDAPQILLTTHSPVILAGLRNYPQHLRYVDTVHRDGRRVTRARAVGNPSEEDPRLVVSPREIDRLLHAVSTEDAEWPG